MKVLFTVVFAIVCFLSLLTQPVYAGVELTAPKIEMFFTLFNKKDNRVLTAQGEEYIRSQIIEKRYDYQDLNYEYKNWGRAVESKTRVVVDFGRKRFIIAEGLMDGRSYLFAPAANDEILINQIKFQSLNISDFLHVDKNHRIAIQ